MVRGSGSRHRALGIFRMGIRLCALPLKNYHHEHNDQGMAKTQTRHSFLHVVEHSKVMAVFTRGAFKTKNTDATGM